MLWDPFLYCINDSIQGKSETGNKVFVLTSKVSINSLSNTHTINNIPTNNIIYCEYKHIDHFYIFIISCKSPGLSFCISKIVFRSFDIAIYKAIL